MTRMRLLSLGSLLLVAMVSLLHVDIAQAQDVYDPPEDVTLTMYQLLSSGASSGTPCTKNVEAIKFSYGCTAIAYDDDYGYPFNSSTIIIGIDHHNGVDNSSQPEEVFYEYHYNYLWDVVTHEYGVAATSTGDPKPFSGVKAQAVASRSYVYQRIETRGVLNNSASDQVFIPYSYAALDRNNPDSPLKIKIREAAADRWYMTPTFDNSVTPAIDESIHPILAQYGRDNRERTSEGITEGKTAFAEPNYLASVADSINEAYGCWFGDANDNGQADPEEFGATNADCGTGNGGMSSKRASRWSFGHTSSRGPVALGDLDYPHDDSGYGDFWSVQWHDAFQILTHYYTGIHIRDANGGNAVITPDHRWVPLSMSGLSSWSDSLRLCKNIDVSVTVHVQNTGISDWDTATANLGYHASWYAGAAAPITAAEASTIVSPGTNSAFTFSVPVPANVAPGAYVLEFDMCQTGASSSGGNCRYFSEDGWPRYSVNVEVIEGCPVGSIDGIFLPIIIRDIAVQ